MDICQILGLITQCDEELNGEGHGFRHKLTNMSTTKVIQMELSPPRAHTEIGHVIGIKGIVLRWFR